MAHITLVLDQKVKRSRQISSHEMSFSDDGTGADGSREEDGKEGSRDETGYSSECHDMYGYSQDERTYAHDSMDIDQGCEGGDVS